MKRIYRKVDPHIWNDEKFMSMSTEARLIFTLTLVHPNLTSVGAMRATVEGLTHELWGRQCLSKGFGELFAKGFDELFEKGLVKYDERVGLWWFPNFIKYNLPENPNVVKSWEKAIYYLPECELLNELIHNIQELGNDEQFGKWLPKRFVELFAKQFRNRLPNLLTNNTKQITNNNTMCFCSEWFNKFWSIYPKKVNKKCANDVYHKQVKTLELHQKIIEAVKLQTLDREYAERYNVFHANWTDPTRYLKKERWNDIINGEEHYREEYERTNKASSKSNSSSYNEHMQESYDRLQKNVSEKRMDEDESDLL